MEPFTIHRGLAAPFDRPNVDTDQIIPKQFLKRIERSGFGAYLFYDLRFAPDHTPNPDFVLNQAAFAKATILLAGKNFGCGSSREHAPWALADFGFRAIVAPSFADIFANNCLKNGLLPVILADEQVDTLVARARSIPAYEVVVDLHERMVADDHGFAVPFSISESARHRLLNGLDDIGLTLRHVDLISAYETLREGRW